MGRPAIVRRRRRRGRSRFRFVLILLVLAALVYAGGRAAFSPRGRFFTATVFLGGGPARLKPVLEGALARAARDLQLPPPYPQLLCEPDTAGTHTCSTVVGLTSGVSTLQGNARFTREITALGASLLSGVEERDGTVTLLYRAGRKVRLQLQLVPAVAAPPETLSARPGGGPPVEVRARLALILEDYGENRLLTRRFAELPGVLTVAVRSNQDNPDGWAQEARRGGMEVILDLPMEPRDYPTRSPGADAILVDLSGREIRSRVDKALDKVGDVKGVMTYMGTLAVEDRDVMRAVLEELHQRDLYFLDTTESSYSTAPDLAREIGVPIYVVTSISQVDEGKSDAGTIGIRFEDLVRRCRAKGYAIGIIHSKEGTLKVLEDRLPRLAREGIVMRPLTEVMDVHAKE